MSCPRHHQHCRQLGHRHAPGWGIFKWPQVEEFGWPPGLDRALNVWNQAWAKDDRALAMDGKVMKNAIDAQGYQTHILSVIGHESNTCHTQKKSGHCP